MIGGESMKYLKCESLGNFLAKRNGNLLISDAFMKIVSKNVTPYIAEVLGIENISDYICIKIDQFNSIRYFNEFAQMNIQITHKTAPFILCTFLIKWRGVNNQIPQLTDNVRDADVHITVEIDEWEKDKLRYSFFRECYFPVIRKEESGLLFDYQLRCATEEVIYRIQFNDEISDLSLIKSILTDYFTSPRCDGKRVIPGHLEIKKNGLKTLKVSVDLGSLDDAHKDPIDYLRYLSEKFKNIKKVVVD